MHNRWARIGEYNINKALPAPSLVWFWFIATLFLSNHNKSRKVETSYFHFEKVNWVENLFDKDGLAKRRWLKGSTRTYQWLVCIKQFSKRHKTKWFKKTCHHKTEPSNWLTLKKWPSDIMKEISQLMNDKISHEKHGHFNN